MFYGRWEKHDGSASRPTTASLLRGLAYFTLPSRPGHLDSDFALRPSATRDASQHVVPTFGGEAAAPPVAPTTDVTIPRETYLTLLQKAERLRKIDIILDRAAWEFSSHHSDWYNRIDIKTVLHAVFDADDGDDTDPTMPSWYTSGLNVVFLTKPERRTWTRLRSFTGTTGMSDWLQPIRRGIMDLAVSTKRLELRFGVQKNIIAAVHQQYTLEQLAFEAEYLHSEPMPDVEPLSGRAPRWNTRRVSATPASNLVAELAHEISILADRLSVVQAEAAAGHVPFSHHVLDLGEDAPLPAPSFGDGSTPPSSVADGHTPRANLRSPWLTERDVVKGYTVMGLAADTWQSMIRTTESGGPITATSAGLAHATWSRCATSIRRRLGGNFAHPGPDFRGLFAKWLSTTSGRFFHEEQESMARNMINDAREAQARLDASRSSAADIPPPYST